MSKTLFALACSLALLAAPLALQAEDTSQPAVAADDAAAPGCPNAEGGKCCATCQDRAARAAAGEAPQAPMAECPCKRAQRLREKAAAQAADN